MLKIYIVEDMTITRAALEDTILNNGFALAGSAATAEKAWEDIQNKVSPDLVLIDVNLAGEKDGVWLATKIRGSFSIPFVYLTAFGDNQTLHAIEGTKPNGYLMKPYNTPTLLTTINIAISNFKSLKNPEEKNGKVLFIKDSNLRVKLETSEIIYVQSDSNYLTIQLENKKHVIRSKIADFIEELPEVNFVRVHQRYVVNIDKIELVGADHITIDGLDIRISGDYKKELYNALNFH